MKSNKECPLCGKEIDENEDLCENCKEYAENQYSTDFINSSEAKDSESEIEGADTKDADIDNRATAGNTISSDGTKKNTSKMSKTLIFLLLGCVIVVILGIWGVYNVIDARKLGETEEMYWQICVEENTPTSYSKYLVRFPEGKYQELAHDKIDEFRAKEANDWEYIKNSSDLDDYFSFIINYPNTPYIDSVKFKIDSLAWDKAISNGTKEAYKAYLDKVEVGTYEGLYSDEAQYRYEYLAQLKTLNKSSSDSLKIQLNQFYKALSSLDQSKIIVFLDSTFIYNNDTIKNVALKDKLNNYYKTKNIQEAKYEVSEPIINAYIDNQNITFIEFILDKSVKSPQTTSSVKNKRQKPKLISIQSKDTLQVKMNSLHKIISIQKQKDVKTF